MNAPSFPSLWNLPANPVFRRHAAALRPWRFIVWLVVTQVVAAFLWLFTVLMTLRSHDPNLSGMDFGSPAFRGLLEKHGRDAFLLGWLSVMMIQGLLVLVKGTFSVATGVARESNEGMMESQRLTPLPTAHKITGQLLGFPLLENVIALLLIPWAAASAWLGGLSPLMMAKVYLIFGTSALFHHAVGLVAGTMIRQKILAGTLSQMMVLLLHFVLPAFGGLGIGLISHLDMEPAIFSEIAAAIPSIAKPGGPFSSDTVPSPVAFFGWKISVSGYHWIITVTALAALLTMLARRWNDRNSQLLGKAGTTLFAAWMLTLTCGEFLPVFSREGGLSGLLSGGSATLSNLIHTEKGGRLVGAWWMAGFAMTLGLINLLFTLSLVPSPEAISRCRHLRRSPWWSDGRSSLPWVAGISLLTATVWILVADALLRETPAMRRFTLDPSDMLWIASSLVIPALAIHALVLWKGWKVGSFAAFATWIVPLMAATIGLLVAEDPGTWPKWIGGMSGLAMPGYASFAEIAALPEVDCRVVFRASLAFHALATVIFFSKARRRMKATLDRTGEGISGSGKFRDGTQQCLHAHGEDGDDADGEGDVVSASGLQ